MGGLRKRSLGVSINGGWLPSQLLKRRKEGWLVNGPGRRQWEVKGDVTGWMDGEKVGKWAVKCRRYGGRILNENVELKGKEEWRTNTAVGIMYFVENSIYVLRFYLVHMLAFI